MVDKNFHKDHGITDQEAYEMSVSRVHGKAKSDPPAIHQGEDTESGLIENLLKNSFDLILIYDSTGSILGAGSQACAYLGYTSKEIAHVCISELLELKPEVERDLLNYFENGAGAGEAFLISASSLRIPVEIRFCSILFQGLKATMLVAKDLTERNHNEELIHKLVEKIQVMESQKSNLQLEQIVDPENASRLKSSFLANMSHEIRTPMNAIIGFANLLNDQGITTDQIKEYTNVIRSSGGNLLRIIDNILELSRIESNELEINRVLVNLPQLFYEIKEMHVELINSMEKDIILELTIPVQTHRALYNIDQIRLRQVISNLLHNAIKFTEQGKVEFGYRILDRERIEFFVKDTGIGIPGDEIGSVFNRFWHGDNNLIRKYGGTGLGLTITRFLVEKMGSRIGVESTPGKGSEFRFAIDNLDNTEAMGDLPVWDNPPLQEFREMNILIVEDEEVNFILFREMMSNSGISLVWARNGEEAVSLVEKEPFDMILMDMKMPGMDGFAATRRIKQLRPDLPVIAQTAYAMENDRIRCLEAGCDNYLSKPIVKEVLLGMVKYYSVKKD